MPLLRASRVAPGRDAPRLNSTEQTKLEEADDDAVLNRLVNPTTTCLGSQAFRDTVAARCP